MANNDTYAGALEVLSNQIASMMGLPDANVPFCVQMMEMVVNERRSPELAMQKAGVLPTSGANPAGNAAMGLPMGGMPGGSMAGGMSAPGPSMLGAGVPGAGPQMAPSPPNADELGRVLRGAV